MINLGPYLSARLPNNGVNKAEPKVPIVTAEDKVYLSHPVSFKMYPWIPAIVTVEDALDKYVPMAETPNTTHP